jgi:hypothetical protein
LTIWAQYMEFNKNGNSNLHKKGWKKGKPTNVGVPITSSHTNLVDIFIIFYLPTHLALMRKKNKHAKLKFSSLPLYQCHTIFKNHNHHIYTT